LTIRGSVARALSEQHAAAVSDTPFQLRSSRVGDAVVLAIVGEIDMATAPEVERAIDRGHDGTRRVVIDLTEVTFLDSSALNALVHSQRNLAEHDVAFRIVSPSDHAVRNVFDITHLTGPLSVVDSIDDALAH
jgi:anti-anti-sigma factor